MFTSHLNWEQVYTGVKSFVNFWSKFSISQKMENYLEVVVGFELSLAKSLLGIKWLDHFWVYLQITGNENKCTLEPKVLLALRASALAIPNEWKITCKYQGDSNYLDIHRNSKNLETFTKLYRSKVWQTLEFLELLPILLKRWKKFVKIKFFQQ